MNDKPGQIRYMSTAELVEAAKAVPYAEQPYANITREDVERLLNLVTVGHAKGYRDVVLSTNLVAALCGQTLAWMLHCERAPE
jgi:hypothetical protein